MIHLQYLNPSNSKIDRQTPKNSSRLRWMHFPTRGCVLQWGGKWQFYMSGLSLLDSARENQKQLYSLNDTGASSSRWRNSDFAVFLKRNIENIVIYSLEWKEKKINKTGPGLVFSILICLLWYVKGKVQPDLGYFTSKKQKITIVWIWKLHTAKFGVHLLPMATLETVL